MQVATTEDIMEASIMAITAITLITEGNIMEDIMEDMVTMAMGKVIMVITKAMDIMDIKSSSKL